MKKVDVKSFRPASRGSSINDVDNWKEGGVKNWSKLLTDSTKKLPIWGRGLSKIQENFRHCLWMVPRMIDNGIKVSLKLHYDVSKNE